MVTKLSCCFILTIIAVTNGRIYFNQKSADLLQKLSGLKVKHGLNFAHIEGVASLPQRYKKEHPTWHIIDDNIPKMDSNANMNEDKFNFLVAKQRPKQVLRTDAIDSGEMSDLVERDILRICKKKPKEYSCKRKCHPFKTKHRASRSGDRNEEDNDDDTPRLLADLEKLLNGNGKYRFFLGCVGPVWR